MLNIGDTAPDFTLNDQSGKEVSLNDFSGKKVVIYFYPKDNTPGCTREANEFNENLETFESHNTAIIGVSKDSVASHEKFCTKFDLKFTLLSDPDITMIQDYGVWQEKKNYGKTYMGIVRSTYLIDENGKVEAIWPKVRVAGHVEAVLEAVTQ